jgi:hypothetical protein
VRQERLRRMAHSAAYPNGVHELIRSEPGETAGHLNYLSYTRSADAIDEFLLSMDAGQAA